MATTSSAVEGGAGTAEVYEFRMDRDLTSAPCGNSFIPYGAQNTGPSTVHPVTAIVAIIAESMT